jgi:hypothetical protein
VSAIVAEGKAMRISSPGCHTALNLGSLRR